MEEKMEDFVGRRGSAECIIAFRYFDYKRMSGIVLRCRMGVFSFFLSKTGAFLALRGLIQVVQWKEKKSRRQGENAREWGRTDEMRDSAAVDLI